MNQTGIGCKALAADKTIRDASRHGCLEQMAQQIAIPKTAVTVLGKCWVVRHWVSEIKPAEPAVGKVEMNLFAKPAF